MGLIRILRLSRPHALASIAFILVGVQCGIIEPVFEQAGVANPFTTCDFIRVLLAEVLIAAGGFVINGYFDLRADLITKPQRVIVGRDVSRRQAIASHFGFTLAATILALIPAWHAGRLLLCVLFPLAAGLFWFYSSTYKYQFLIGNLILTVLAFALPLVPFMYEVQCVDSSLWSMAALGAFPLAEAFQKILGVSVALAALTILLALVNEVQRFTKSADLGANSLPVRIGLKGTKLVVAGLYLVVLALFVGVALRSLLVHYDEFGYLFTPLYLLLAMCPPVVVSMLAFLVGDQYSYYRFAYWALALDFPLLGAYLLLL